MMRGKEGRGEKWMMQQYSSSTQQQDTEEGVKVRLELK